jgi:hypothetical protein
LFLHPEVHEFRAELSRGEQFSIIRISKENCPECREELLPGKDW